MKINKKYLMVILVLLLTIININTVSAYNEITIPDSEVIEQEISPMNVNRKSTFNLQPGRSFRTSFKMTDPYNTWPDPHTGFTVRVSDVSGGSYRIVVTANNGYNWSSPEYTGNSSATTRNCSPTATYTVIITNTKSTTVRGTVSINSFF